MLGAATLGGSAAEGSAVLRISDATQLTLYTLDALQEVVEWANQGHGADETACLWLAYLRWLGTQGERHPAEAPRPLPRPIDEHEVLHAVREPDGTVLAALRSGRMGEVERPLQPEAKGAGPVLRSSPFGLLPHVGWRTLAPLAINGAALTHGHPEAQTAATGRSGSISRPSSSVFTKPGGMDCHDRRLSTATVNRKVAPGSTRSVMSASKGR